MNNDKQLAIHQPLSLGTWDEMSKAAATIAESGMFGLKNPAQAMTLMLLCQAEGMNPIEAFRTYHIVEGKPSMRADAMQGKFESRGGGIIWHVRTDVMVAGTLFRDKRAIDDKARERAVKRFDFQWQLIDAKPEAAGKLMVELAKLSREGEETIIRTYADAEAKGLTQGRDGTKSNWQRSPRQMLTARFVTEGVRLLDPGLVAGIVSDEEAREIAEVERAEVSDVANDIPGMTRLMEQHVQRASEATTPQEKQKWQGLAAELRCQIADRSMTLAKTVEVNLQKGGDESSAAHVTMNSNPESSIPVVQSTPQPSNAAATSKPEAEAKPDWREVVCHVGLSTGQLLGRKLGEMNRHLLQWLVEKWAPSVTHWDAKDLALHEAAKEGLAAQPQPEPQKPAASPESAPLPPADSPIIDVETSKVPDWRSVVIPFPECKGKTLGGANDVDKGLRWIAVNKMPAFEADLLTPTDAEMAFVAAFGTATRERAIDTEPTDGLFTPYVGEEKLRERILGALDDMALTREQGEEYLFKIELLKVPLSKAQHPAMLAIWHDWANVSAKIRAMVNPPAAPKAKKGKAKK